MLEIGLSHLQHIAGIRQKHIAAFTVFCHVLVLPLLECFQFFWVIALNPASFVQTGWFPTALRIVFILQTILDYLELQLPHRADKFAPVELINEQLGHALVHQLVDAFGQLLGFHRVGILNVFEHLR